MVLSKDAQKALDEITPKMSFVNCVAAIGKMAQYYTNFDYFRKKLNKMEQKEQEVLANQWEAKGFTRTQDFLDFVKEQPYFHPTWEEATEAFRQFAVENGGYYNYLPDGNIEVIFDLYTNEQARAVLKVNKDKRAEQAEATLEKLKLWLLGSRLTAEQYADKTTTDERRHTHDFATTTLERFFPNWRKEQTATQDEDALFTDFKRFVEDHDGVIEHQMSDVPYSTGVFGLPDGRIMTLTYMEDVECFFADLIEKKKSAKK